MTWETVPLGELVELRYGKALKAEDRDGGGYPVIGSGGVAGSHSAALVEHPTIVVGRKGSIGSLTYAADGCWPIDTVYYAAPRTELHLRWLYWTMQSLGLETMNKSAAVPGLNRDDAYRIRVPLPPLPEQRRIAAILDEAEAVRGARRASGTLLQAARDGLYPCMFGSIQAARTRFPTVTLAEVSTSSLGRMLDKKRETGEHARPYLRNANVQWFRFDTNDVAEMDFAPEIRPRYRLRPGDVLICEGGQPGRCAVWKSTETEMYFQKALHRVRTDPDRLTPDVLAHTMLHLSKGGHLGEAVSVATIAHLTGEQLARLEVPLPPMEQQREFQDRLDEMDQHAHRLAEHAASLDALFASLQHRAFRGEL